jgi:hypothetical protein
MKPTRIQQNAHAIRMLQSFSKPDEHFTEKHTALDANFCSCGKCGDMLNFVCREIKKSALAGDTCFKWHYALLEIWQQYLINIEFVSECGARADAGAMAIGQPLENIIDEEQANDVRQDIDTIVEYTNNRIFAILAANSEYIAKQLNQEIRLAYEEGNKNAL